MTGSEVYLFHLQYKGSETAFSCVFVMDKVALGQFFSEYLQFSSFSIILLIPYTFLSSTVDKCLIVVEFK